jgi:hypothetical protein
MNDPLALSKVVTLCLKLGWQEAIKRLESVQGPEQGLVGESRSGSETCPAEAAKRGERGVAEIVERIELLRHIERHLIKARSGLKIGKLMVDSITIEYWIGYSHAMLKLKEEFSDTAEKRSDLSNA